MLQYSYAMKKWDGNAKMTYKMQMDQEKVMNVNQLHDQQMLEQEHDDLKKFPHPKIKKTT